MSTPRTQHPTIAAIVTEMQRQEISQTELARRLGWGRMQVHRRLHGDADLTVPELQEVAAALDVPVSRLLPAEVAK